MAIMMVTIIFIALLLIPLIPVLILYFWKLKGCKQSGPIVVSLLVFQSIVMAILWAVFISGIPSAAAIIMPGVLAVYFAVNFVIGIALCPLFYFSCTKPKGWIKTIVKILSGYVVVLVLVFSQLIVTKIGLNNNVDLYGQVTNINGSPVGNAQVYIENCSYMKDNPAVTDEMGLFNVKAHCGSYMFVAKIYDPQQDAYCQSRFNRQLETSSDLVIFDDFDTEDNPLNRPHWKNYGKDNPFLFACMWELPQNLIKREGSIRVENKDGIYRVDIKAKHREKLLSENGDLEIEYLANKGVFVIKMVRGSVQKTNVTSYGHIEIAPESGYKNKLEYHVSDLSSFRNSQSLFFNINDTYGYLNIAPSLSRGKLRIDFKFIYNPDGGTNLITHDYSFKRIN